jgi:hypothetical protein
LVEPLQNAREVDDGQVFASGLLAACGDAPKGFERVEEDFDQIAMSAQLLTVFQLP